MDLSPHFNADVYNVIRGCAPDFDGRPSCNLYDNSICGPMSVPTLTPIMTASDAQHFVMEFYHTHRLLSGVASSIS